MSILNFSYLDNNCTIDVDNKHSIIKLSNSDAKSYKMYHINKIKIYNKFIPILFIPKNQRNDIKIKFSYYDDIYKDCVLIGRNIHMDIYNNKYTEILTFKFKHRISVEYNNFRVNLDSYMGDDANLTKTKELNKRVDMIKL